MFPILISSYSRNQATTPHHSSGNQATTPHHNHNQAKTPWHSHRKKAVPGHYDMSCSTTTLRRHLANNHWEVWITSCREAGIEITSTSKEVCRALDRFEQRHGHRHGDNMVTVDGTFPVYRTYTPKTFLDALIKWIVADDQVCSFCLPIVYCSCIPFVTVSQCY